jgi:hypothetical protein
MAGFLLVHESQLAPRKQDGIPMNSHRLGFLDYLRELRQDVFPFAPNQKIRIVGVEDVLLAAGNNSQDVMSYLHHVMTSRASELERIGGWVQVAFRRKLVRADDFWLEHGQERISLRRLFDSPQRQIDPRGNEYYTVGFNLT